MVFTKMHGAGNDYVYVDCTKEELENQLIMELAVWDYLNIQIQNILLYSGVRANFTQRSFMMNWSMIS